ncbi:MAG: Rieske (2Fe-2S) protein [Thermoplasmata archaeon]
MKIDATHPPEPGKSIRVIVDGTPVAVFNVGGVLFGLDARCTHVGGPMDRGPVSGMTVTCPLHGSQFDIGTGAVIRGPAVRPLKCYRVRSEADGLTIDPM